jgi:hypothetical protein
VRRYRFGNDRRPVGSLWFVTATESGHILRNR